MGPDHEHLCLLHTTGKVQELPRRPRHRDKRRRDDPCSGSSDVGIRDVHRRTTHRVGQPTRRSKDMGCAPRFFHSEVAGAPPIFTGHGEAVPIQGCRPSRARTSSSRGGRRGVRDDVRSAPRAAQIADGRNGCVEPKGDGSDVRKDERHNREQRQSGR